MKFNRQTLSTAVAAATLMAVTLVPAQAQATDGYVSVYFTRHAEKMTDLVQTGDASSAYDAEYFSGNDLLDEPVFTENGAQVKGKSFDEVCGEGDGNPDKVKCAEVLSDEGELRAMLLADFLGRWGVTRRLDAVYSSHKVRTYQTVLPTATAAGLTVQRLPADGEELNPESTSPSICPTVGALVAAANDASVDTVLVAGHSGSLYQIMGTPDKGCAGLGLDTSDDNRFPKDSKGKVRDFGDLWKVIVRADGTARFVYRVNLQPKYLFIENKAF